MQSPDATIYQFERLLQEILPKVQAFKNQIVETESDYLCFFRNFLKAEAFAFEDCGQFIAIEPIGSKPNKPGVLLKFNL